MADPKSKLQLLSNKMSGFPKIDEEKDEPAKPLNVPFCRPF
jgi:hypothetical protein